MRKTKAMLLILTCLLTCFFSQAYAAIETILFSGPHLTETMAIAVLVYEHEMQLSSRPEAAGQSQNREACDNSIQFSHTNNYQHHRENTNGFTIKAIALVLPASLMRKNAAWEQILNTIQTLFPPQVLERFYVFISYEPIHCPDDDDKKVQPIYISSLNNHLDPENINGLITTVSDYETAHHKNKDHIQAFLNHVKQFKQPIEMQGDFDLIAKIKSLNHYLNIISKVKLKIEETAWENQFIKALYLKVLAGSIWTFLEKNPQALNSIIYELVFLKQNITDVKKKFINSINRFCFRSENSDLQNAIDNFEEVITTHFTDQEESAHLRFKFFCQFFDHFTDMVEECLKITQLSPNDVIR